MRSCPICIFVKIVIFVFLIYRAFMTFCTVSQLLFAILSSQNKKLWQLALSAVSEETPAKAFEFFFAIYFYFIIKTFSINRKASRKKRQTFSSQADRRHWPPLMVSFLWFFWVYFWPDIMIICILKRILHKKKSIFMQLLESPIPPLTATALHL